MQKFSRLVFPLIVIVSSSTMLFSCAMLSGRAKATARLPLFNQYVVKMMESYPTDGTHGYWWPRGGEGPKGWEGATRDVEYGGVKMLHGEPGARCYCCGLTFEVLLRAMLKYLEDNGAKQIKDWEPEKVIQLRRQWFGGSGDRTLVQSAIVSNDLGVAITDFEEARRGDFIQFWRTTGSGHSVIFDKWVRDKEGQIIALHYWSTQKATNGIGYRTEYFASEERAKGIKKEETYIARIIPEKLLAKTDNLGAPTIKQSKLHRHNVRQNRTSSI